VPSTNLRTAIYLVLSVSLAGCGPFGYLKKVAKDANRSVAAAKAAGAEEHAPYEYWGAVSYLEQAKVMMAYSEYERSFDYGERAVALAEEAKKKTDMRRKGKTVERKEGIAAPDEDVGPIQKGAPEGEEKAAEGAAKAGAEGKVEAGEAKGEAEGKVEVGG